MRDVKVRSGIHQEKREDVLRLINAQLESLRKGGSDNRRIGPNKSNVGKDQFLLSLDNPQALMENAYFNLWLPHTKMSEDQFITGIETVTVRGCAENCSGNGIKSHLLFGKE